MSKLPPIPSAGRGSKTHSGVFDVTSNQLSGQGKGRFRPRGATRDNLRTDWAPPTREERIRDLRSLLSQNLYLCDEIALNMSLEKLDYKYIRSELNRVYFDATRIKKIYSSKKDNYGSVYDEEEISLGLSISGVLISYESTLSFISRKYIDKDKHNAATEVPVELRIRQFWEFSQRNSVDAAISFAEILFPELNGAARSCYIGGDNLQGKGLTEETFQSSATHIADLRPEPPKWASRYPGDTPPSFIHKHYGIWRDGVWDRNGLTKADLRRADLQLYNALAKHNSRHPDDSLELPGRTEVSDAWVQRVNDGNEAAPSDARGAWRLAAARQRKASRDRQ